MTDPFFDSVRLYLVVNLIISLYIIVSTSAYLVLQFRLPPALKDTRGPKYTRISGLVVKGCFLIIGIIYMFITAGALFYGIRIPINMQYLIQTAVLVSLGGATSSTLSRLIWERFQYRNIQQYQKAIDARIFEERLFRVSHE